MMGTVNNIPHPKELRETILEKLTTGATKRSLAAQYGVHEVTIRRWERKREKDIRRLAGKLTGKDEEKIPKLKAAQRLALVPLDASASVVRVLDNQARLLLGYLEDLTAEAGKALSDGNHSIFKAIKKIRKIMDDGAIDKPLIDADGDTVMRRVPLDLQDLAEIGRLLKSYMGQLYENFTIPRGVIRPDSLLTQPAAANHLHLHGAGPMGNPLSLTQPAQPGLPAPEVIDIEPRHLAGEENGVSEEQRNLLAACEE